MTKVRCFGRRWGQVRKLTLGPAQTRCLLTLGPAQTRCLLDTGAEVSCLTESFYQKEIASANDCADVSSYLCLSAANDQTIPFMGYVELDVSAPGRTFGKMGFLIVEDVAKRPMARYKEQVL